MELCAKCPMHDERYTPSDVADKLTIARMRDGFERRGDFIEWLFEHSEHCNHISYSEAWEEFSKWEDKQNENPVKE